MHLNPNFFILGSPPHIVVWDYEAHKQFELDAEHASRLIELICDPEKLDRINNVDKLFIENGLFIDAEVESREWGWDVLSKIFHVGTKNIPQEHRPKDVNEWAKAYYEHCRDISLKPKIENPLKITGFASIKLPSPYEYELPVSELKRVLLGRKTCRSFSLKSVRLELLSTILYFSFGYLAERVADDYVSTECSKRRSSPSGGGLNACEVYVYVHAVQGIDAGVYHYDASEHSLSYIGPMMGCLGDYLGGQHFANDLPFGAFLMSRFDKMWWKYEHSRAYRVSLFDVGHLSQTFQLVSTACGLGTWLTAAFSEEKLEKVLGVDGWQEQPLMFVGAGYSDGAVLCDQLLKLLDGGQNEVL